MNLIYLCITDTSTLLILSTITFHLQKMEPIPFIDVGDDIATFLAELCMNHDEDCDEDCGISVHGQLCKTPAGPARLKVAIYFADWYEYNKKTEWKTRKEQSEEIIHALAKIQKEVYGA